MDGLKSFDRLIIITPLLMIFVIALAVHIASFYWH